MIMYTVDLFIQKIWNMGASLGLHSDYLDDSFLDTADVYEKQTVLTRIHAARIIHQYLIYIIHESDIDDWSYARQLSDLYDCHTCVNHIAQIVSKGIMEPIEADGRLLFQSSHPVDDVSASKYIKRMFSLNDRIRIPSIDRTVFEAERISFEKFNDYISQNRFSNLLLIDVRSKQQFDKNHLVNAKHIPLSDILDEKYGFQKSPETTIIIYCDKGYLSQIAANFLVEYGFQNVFYMSL